VYFLLDISPPSIGELGSPQNPRGGAVSGRRYLSIM
jgi:hypothetical protein